MRTDAPADGDQPALTRRRQSAVGPRDPRRRPVLGGLGAAVSLAVALATSGGSGCGFLGGDELTIVVVSLDTTRLEHLTPYDPARSTTPTLARLADEGARFTQARTTSPWTLPSHMSLFTGLPPGLHDVNIDFQVLDAGRRTMGEIFHDAGYRTMGVFSGPYVHGRFGFDRGMDFYERATVEPMVWDLPAGSMRQQLLTREAMSHQEVTSARVVERAHYMLRNTTRDKNLLFLHFFDPHYDYLAPRGYVQRFADPAYDGPIAGKGITGNPALRADMPAADRHQLEALYDAELAYVDDALSALLATLEREGRLDRALIVVTADHGEAFFEQGAFGHRRDLSEAVLRVPLIVWGPALGVPAGVTIDEPVSVVDVLPTLIDYAGLPPEPDIDGRSLRPLLEGKSRPPQATTAALSFFPAPPKGYYELHEAMVIGRMKVELTRRVTWSEKEERNLSGEVVAGSERWRVYDLEADPGERNDLSGTDDPRVPGLLEAFRAERARQRDLLERYRPRGHDAPDLGLTLTESMQAVGYLETATDDGSR